MSDAILVAFIMGIFGLLSALIGAFAKVYIEGKKPEAGNDVGCATLGLFGSIAGLGGLIIGAFFAMFIVGGINVPPTSIPTPTSVSSDNSASPTQSQSTSNTTSTVMQVGPYLGYRNELGTETLMLNILAQGDECLDRVSINVDGQQYQATLISDTSDPHYRKDSLSIGGGSGYSCNYLVGNQVIIPSQYFTVQSATYGVGLDSWCFESTDKTWRPCN